MNIYKLTVFVGQRFGNGSAIWFCLRVSHTVETRKSKEGLTVATASHFQDGSLTGLLARCLRPSPCRLLRRAAPDEAANFLGMSDPKEKAKGQPQ